MLYERKTLCSKAHNSSMSGPKFQKNMSCKFLIHGSYWLILKLEEDIEPQITHCMYCYMKPNTNGLTSNNYMLATPDQRFLKKTLYFAKLKSMIEIFVNINCLMMKTLVPTVTEQLNDRQTDQPTVRYICVVETHSLCSLNARMNL